MCKAEGTVLRTEQDDINLAADRDPTELGWGNSQRTLLGTRKAAGSKDRCGHAGSKKKNLLRERKTLLNHWGWRHRAGWCGSSPTLPPTSKEMIEKKAFC